MIETLTQTKPAAEGSAPILTTNGVIEITYIKLKKEASKDVELLTLPPRPFYLPREFTNVYVPTIYTPPDSNVENANKIINKHVNDLMTKSHDCIKILTGDFNNSRDINIPGLLPYVNCLTTGNATLDFFPMSRTLILVSNRRPSAGLTI